MKTCKNCGTKNFDINTKCDKCNYPLYEKGSYQMKAQSPAPIYNKTPNNQVIVSQKESGLATAAKILMIISTILYGISLVVFFIFWLLSMTLRSEYPSIYTNALAIEMLIYMICVGIPFVISFIFTKSYCEKLDDGEKISTAFKVCVLLLVSLLAGIFMLIDNTYVEEKITEPTVQSRFDENVDKIQKYKELLNKGIITQEEFESKKKELLNL